MNRPLSWSQLRPTLPAPALQYLADKGQTGDLAYSTVPYYSRVRLAPNTITADGSNNTTYSFSLGNTVLPFQYGQGQRVSGTDPTLTEFASATQADTNLQTARQTVDGALVVIRGISIQLTPWSDSEMAAALWPELSLTSGFGTLTSQYKHGVPAFLPGGSSLFGGGTTTGQTPNTFDSYAVVPGFTTNGMPLDDNEHATDDQLVWFPSSENSSEANFGMVLTLNRAVSYVSAGRAAGITATGGATGTIPAVIPPITIGARGTYVDLMFKMNVVAIYPRSKNS